MKADWSRWTEIPALNGRVATEEDFEAGRAIFYQISDCEATNERILPALAKFRDEDGVFHDAVVIQIERKFGADTNSVVVCGAYIADGRNVVCLSDDLVFDLEHS